MYKRLSLGLAALAVASTMAAQPVERGMTAAEETVAIVTEQLNGTTLALTPRATFDRAILRIAGPEDYALTKRFPGGSLIMADLLAEAEPRRAFIEGRESTVRGPLAFLPDGRYRYEVKFTLGGKRRWHTGLFYVDAGTVLRRDAMRDRLARMRRSLQEDQELAAGSSGGIGTDAYAADDYILIADLTNDGTTVLDMGSDTPGGAKILDWSLINKDGVFYIDDSLTIGAPNDTSNPEVTIEGGVHLAATGDGSSTRLGVGTSAPQEALHILSQQPAILLDNELGAAWQIGAGGGGSLVFTLVDPGGFGGTQGTKLGISSAGQVAIGVASPEAMLHVGGSGIIEGDVSLGSSRTVKHAVEALDTATVLAAVRDLPLYRWKYKDDPAQAPHAGPMAEDVFAAFQVGRDDKHLSPADSAGLALAAVQGLDSRLDRELAELRAVVAELASDNSRLRHVNKALRQQLNRTQPLVTGP